MVYENEHLNKISFPLGGIGTGSVGLRGNGSFYDWEIWNKPNKGSINGYTHIAVTYDDGKKRIAKVLQGDRAEDLEGHYGYPSVRGFGFGPQAQTMCGFPHFSRCVFDGRFPTAEITFSDDGFPGKVVLRAFNPFVPLDSDASSIPAAFFEIFYKNDGETAVSFGASFLLSNKFASSRNTEEKNGDVVSMKLINAGKNETDVEYADMSVSCVAPTAVQPYTYRGAWQDGISTYWNELSAGALSHRVYKEDGSWDMAALQKEVTVKPGERVSIRFVLSWNTPNNYNYWKPYLDENGRDISWKNYYATVFRDSVASGVYSLLHFDELYEKTVLFRDALHNSTLDPAVIDAVSSTLSVLKSPTVYRLENGEFYGFEGVASNAGSCEGTCQHVYNYAYAMAFLFPDLERSIRNLEFEYCTYSSGGMRFRIELPLSRNRETEKGTSCLDGQMGAVIKTYREWKISGDTEWLRRVFPTVKRILAYAWSEENEHAWDRNKDGVLEGRQHHTLDVELFGPSAWLEGFYLAALSVAAEMAEFLGENEAASEYRRLLESGKRFTKEELFNGKYFIHKIDISDKSLAEKFGCEKDYWNEETGELKYQIAEGSSIDQLTAEWHRRLLGIGEIFDKEEVHTALQNLYRNNFKPSMREVTNMWRIFAAYDEGGAIMCDYPEGAYKPKIPITYCEECMTGFEYSLAGLLYSEGMVKEALAVVRAVRDRYDGKKRNPYNELECGSNYVRAMAAFALLPIAAGFSFDLARGEIGFSPVEEGDFRSLFSLASGWGVYEREGAETKITLSYGSLALSRLRLPYLVSPRLLLIDGKETAFTFENGVISFDPAVANKEIYVK